MTVPRALRRVVRVTLVLVLAVPLVVVAPSTSVAYTRIGYVRDMVVDGARERIFMTGDDNASAILVANYEGEIVDKIEDEPGAAFMELVGESLYVSLPASNAIHEINTATLERVNVFDTGEATAPEHLAKIGNYLWFFYDCPVSNRLASLDLTTGFVETYETPLHGSCPDVEGAPGNDRDVFVFNPIPDDGSQITVFETLAGRVIRERGVVTGSGNVLFDAAGETFVSYWQREVFRYRTSDLEVLETARVPAASAFDQSADGTTFALGRGRLAELYQKGFEKPSSTWGGDGQLILTRGLRVTPDGSRFFAVTYSTEAYDQPYRFNVFIPTRAVRASNAFEYQPGGDGEHLTWTQRASYGARNNSVMAATAGGPPFRVNPKGTEAWSGGVDGSRLIYQQRRSARNSDLFFYDLARKKRRPAARKINTRAWEYLPSLSGDRLLFARIDRRFKTRRIMLANLKSGRVVTLDRMAASNPYLTPGQMNGRFATWVKCTSRCDVFRYDAVSRRKIRLPNPKVEDNFGPAVTKDGTVYFGRGAGGCGRNIRLMKYADGKLSKVMDYPPHKDFYTSFAFENEDGGTSLYLDALTCTRDAIGRVRVRSDVVAIDGL